MSAFTLFSLPNGGSHLDRLELQLKKIVPFKGLAFVCKCQSFAAVDPTTHQGPCPSDTFVGQLNCQRLHSLASLAK